MYQSLLLLSVVAEDVVVGYSSEGVIGGEVLCRLGSGEFQRAKRFVLLVSSTRLVFGVET